MTKTETAEEAIALFEATQPAWIERARASARRIGQNRGSATIDDVREACPPPDGVDPRVMGAVFRSSDWRPTQTFKKSVRTECHRRPIRVHLYVGPP